jgi:hypothetical protein
MFTNFAYKTSCVLFCAKSWGWIAYPIQWWSTNEQIISNYHHHHLNHPSILSWRVCGQFVLNLVPWQGSSLQGLSWIWLEFSSWPVILSLLHVLQITTETLNCPKTIKWKLNTTEIIFSQKMVAWPCTTIWINHYYHLTFSTNLVLVGACGPLGHLSEGAPRESHIRQKPMENYCSGPKFLHVLNIQKFKKKNEKKKTLKKWKGLCNNNSSYAGI